MKAFMCMSMGGSRKGARKRAPPDMGKAKGWATRYQKICDLNTVVYCMAL
jgi:hypothetical protein